MHCVRVRSQYIRRLPQLSVSHTAFSHLQPRWAPFPRRAFRRVAIWLSEIVSAPIDSRAMHFSAMTG